MKYIREHRGYETAAQAAIAFGFNANTYKSNENGTRAITAENAQRYAIAFRVRPGWLLYGEGDWDTGPASYGKINLASSTIPILDWEIVANPANIGDAVASAQFARHQEKDFQLSALAFRLINKDESMTDTLRRERHSFGCGDHLVFDPERGIVPGCYVLIRILADNSTVFRQYWERGSDSNGRRLAKLHAFNPAWPDEEVVVGETAEIIARLVQHIIDHS